ncbi:hypothetical protein CHS0354_030393 [Potamilus streckersoni]|uniref:Potassium channel domain-containing protein n=1 Tax=Potamilus streckersoni TaxID=2493646 RepID=A0AAE0VRD6_9BIVA|nr:hypothetical protein CHS0354_030393 [Potamilus streckersoni]
MDDDLKNTQGSLTLAEAEIFDDSLLAKNSERSNKTIGLIKVKARKACKETSLFLLSNIGSISMVVCYSIMGGFLFQAIERPYEIRTRTFVSDIRKGYIQRLWRANMDYNIFHRENWTNEADAILRTFQTEIFAVVRDKGWDGIDESAMEKEKWSFTGSLLFSVSIITTIGYGYITPKTDEGRVVTMLYAVIGIPLMLLCVTNIGSILATCVRALYGRTLCISCRQNVVLFFKRKFGHTNESINRMELIAKYNRNEVVTNAHSVSTRTECAAVMHELNTTEHHHRTEEVRVPIVVSLILMIWYVIFGAIMFSIWEKDWDMLIGAYFCFTTLSTIGFGDFVPGHQNEDWNDHAKQVSCALYVLLGMSLVAMCFELIQNECRMFAKRLGQFVGLIKPISPK